MLYVEKCNDDLLFICFYNNISRLGQRQFSNNIRRSIAGCQAAAGVVCQIPDNDAILPFNRIFRIDNVLKDLKIINRIYYISWNQ